MKILKILIFVMFSLVDVRIAHAEAEVTNALTKTAIDTVTLPNDRGIAQEPGGCIEQTSCAFKTHVGLKYKFDLGDTAVTLGSDSGLVRESDEKITLLGGTILVEDAAVLRIEIPSCEIELRGTDSDGAEAIVERTRLRTYVKVISGYAIIRPRGNIEAISIQPGFENWIGRVVAKNKTLDVGIPTSLAWAATVRQWGPLFSGPKSEFAEKLEDFKPVWRAAVIASSELHRTKAEREVASVENERQRQINERARLARERAMMRRQFWERVFEAPPDVLKK